MFIWLDVVVIRKDLEGLDLLRVGKVKEDMRS